jgi:hypothetical protein
MLPKEAQDLAIYKMFKVVVRAGKLFDSLGDWEEVRATEIMQAFNTFRRQVDW